MFLRPNVFMPKRGRMFGFQGRMVMMKRFALFMAILAFCIHYTEVRSPSTIDDGGQTKTSATAARQQSRMGLVSLGTTIAQRATIDPETGEFVSPPEHETPASNESNQPSAFSIRAEMMEEESSPVPGGGVMIDLKGRFKSPVRATIEASGKTTIEHPASGRME
jgi:hypothetical protein